MSLSEQLETAHRFGVLAAMAGLQDAALEEIRLTGPDVPRLADAAVSSATPFVRAPLLARISRALLLHPLRQLFTPAERKGKRRFLANYAAEALVPMTAQDRTELPRFSGCINCGLCDAVCPLVGRAAPEDFRGPSLFALAYSRATPELPHLRRVISTLDECGSCHVCQDVCPRAVPLLAIFAFTKRKLLEVDAALAPEADAPTATELDIPALPGLGT